MLVGLGRVDVAEVATSRCPRKKRLSTEATDLSLMSNDNFGDDDQSWIGGGHGGEDEDEG